MIEGVAYRLAEKIKDAAGYDHRIRVPGHIQRGGSPSSQDAGGDHDYALAGGLVEAEGDKQRFVASFGILAR